jgi:hypothetical protein
MPSYDVITDFWEWYRRRHARQHELVAEIALDKCEETFRQSDWDNFGYWYAIYLRERPKIQNLRRHVRITAERKPLSGNSGR